MTTPTLGRGTSGSSLDDTSKHDYFHLFWIFLIASLFGLIVETIVSFPIDGTWKNRTGLLLGSISPIYGTGAALMTVLFWRLHDKHPVVLFLAASLFGGAFEYFAAWVFESAFGFVAWSYIDRPFNVHGKTCLAIALCWGTLGVLWIRLLLPRVVALIDRIPRKVGTVATVVLTAIVAVDIALTILAFNCWYERVAGFPAESPVQEYFAENYGNDYMEKHFETISVHPELAKR